MKYGFGIDLGGTTVKIAYGCGERNCCLAPRKTLSLRGSRATWQSLMFSSCHPERAQRVEGSGVFVHISASFRA